MCAVIYCDRSPFYALDLLDITQPFRQAVSHQRGSGWRQGEKGGWGQRSYPDCKYVAHVYCTMQASISSDRRCIEAVLAKESTRLFIILNKDYLVIALLSPCGTLYLLHVARSLPFLLFPVYLA